MIVRLRDMFSFVAVLIGVFLMYATFSTDDYIVMCANKGIPCDQTTPWWLLGVAAVLVVGGIITSLTGERK